MIVGASGLPSRPSFASVPGTASPGGGTDPAARRPARGVPQASLASGSLPHLSHRGGDNEHPASGLSERQSRPIVLLGRRVMPHPGGGPLMSRTGPRSSPPASPADPRRPGGPRGRSPSPRTSHRSARSPHGSGRSTPSRDKPLTARLVGRLAGERLAEPNAPREVDLISAYSSTIVCPSVPNACTAGRITIGRFLPAPFRAAFAPTAIHSECADTVLCFDASVPDTALSPTNAGR